LVARIEGDQIMFQCYRTDITGISNSSSSDFSVAPTIVVSALLTKPPSLDSHSYTHLISAYLASPEWARLA